MTFVWIRKQRATAVVLQVAVLVLGYLAGQAAFAATAEDLAKDPEFKELVELQLAFRERHRETFAKMSKEDRAELSERLEGVFEKGKTRKRRMSWVSKRTGVKVEELSRVQTLMVTLAKRYPELRGKDAASFLEAALFGRGPNSSVLFFCLFCSEYEFHAIDPDWENDPCLERCHDILVSENEEITIKHYAALLGCALPQIAPGPGTVISFGCFFVEQIRAMVEYAAALNDHDRCRAQCRESDQPEPPAECSSPNDCPAGEYCYLYDGPLNNPIPDPYCRPERREKDECRYDYQCVSGCCKFYGWWSLTHDVCRPLSKCD